jgi:hypothetical protein
MNRTIVAGFAFIIIVGFAFACIASETYEILFKGLDSNLSKQDKQQIYDLLGFTFSKDNKFVDEICGDMSPEVEVVDLNGDGIMEVFVMYGNACMSGYTGRSISLFVKNSAGRYAENFYFPAINYKRLLTKNKDFPDLTFGGPGFCHGVWQWTGSKYDYKCSYEEDPGACIRKGVEKLCK